MSERVHQRSVGSVHRVDVVQPDAAGLFKDVRSGLTVGCGIVACGP